MQGLLCSAADLTMMASRADLTTSPEAEAPGHGPRSEE